MLKANMSLFNFYKINDKEKLFNYFTIVNRA